MMDAGHAKRRAVGGDVDGKHAVKAPHPWIGGVAISTVGSLRHKGVSELQPHQWTRLLSKYREPVTPQGIVELAVLITLVSSFFVWTMALWSLSISNWPAFALALLYSLFLVRMFMSDHLASRIPNYRVPEIQRGHEQLRRCQRVTLRESIRCASLHLWDEEYRRLISFLDARAQNL